MKPLCRNMTTVSHGSMASGGSRILPKDESAMENLARYIIRASFSQERMRYLEQKGTVLYTAKDGRTSKNFPAMDWLAAMC